MSPKRLLNLITHSLTQLYETPISYYRLAIIAIYGYDC